MEFILKTLSAAVGTALSQQKLMLACAESCTGGLVSEIITTTPGSSTWFERGFVTYSNAAKQEMLGVSQSTLAEYGAVSEETARAMVQGALVHSHARIALAITGIAGPGGSSSGKPVGTVCFAWCGVDAAPASETRQFSGTRETIRKQAAVHALNGLLALLEATAKIVP
ncbi:MAG TPA: CinA family protein [Rhodocyclaceae bacterium]|jgi:nicotinamide-nucleotide amidase|nr:CinA family protein [Rhodocyclaceae bacterium]